MVLDLPPAIPPEASDEAEDRAERQHSARLRTTTWCEVGFRSREGPPAVASI